ncbi:aquaporin-like protein [Phakopsora pachyrhizi]|uniref:Aquaporin-like protein n=1 Tax=Phakopsora pachyrhizi TaxID=170000 RepID=A0AAV0AK40_PHAPC|nr:aquaporin-like protein [Phakopsora pachyrhizi]
MLPVINASILEGFGSLVIVWSSGISIMTVKSFDTRQEGVYLGITTALTATLLFYSIGPLTGGHFNPIVSLSTGVNGLISFRRAFSYAISQFLGAIAGGVLVSFTLGHKSASLVKYGCLVGEGFGLLQAFLLEFMSCFITLYCLYELGLSGRKETDYGASLMPFLSGTIIGLVVFIGSGFPGESYSGSNGFPQRCMGLAIGTWGLHQGIFMNYRNYRIESYLK